MKRLVQVLFILQLTSSICHSQGKSRYAVGIDAGSGFTDNAWSPSIYYHEEIGSHRVPWLRFSLGIRAWGYYSGKSDLISQGESSLPDTLKFRNTSVNGISLVPGVTLRLWKIDLGVNTDLAGFTFGSGRNAFYPKNSLVAGDGEAYYNKWVPAAPPRFSILPQLLPDKSSGQSEVFARIFFTRSLGLKVGYVFGKMVYATKSADDRRIRLDNGHLYFADRYRMPYIAVSFSFL
jgi:hypothetical protein